MGNSVLSSVGVIKHFLIIFIAVCEANDNAKRLYDDLLRSSGYNKLIRPVGNNTDKLVVRLGIRLSQLIDIVSRLFSFFFCLKVDFFFFGWGGGGGWVSSLTRSCTHASAGESLVREGVSGSICTQANEGKHVYTCGC